jgi:peptide/nickel transport system substrate-binding protein
MTGSLVRRGRGWIALVFACVVAASATSAGTAGAAGSSSGANSSSEAAKPDLDAEATFAYAIGPANFDPIRPLAFYAYTYEIYDRLTKIDDSLEVQPMLAESWEFSEDGTTLTFHLRDDAKFTDGSKIDAAAVKANIDRARLMPFSTQRTSLSAVSAVDVVDPTTVKLTLVRGQGVQLPSVFAGTAGMIVNPKAIADPTVDLTNGPGKGMESGPWVLESVTLGTSNGEVQYVRRPDWDKEAGRIKRLKVLGISTSVQRINAVRAGDITMGMITDVDVPAAADLMKSKDVGGITVSLITTVFGLEMKPERQAISNL